MFFGTDCFKNVLCGFPSPTLQVHKLFRCQRKDIRNFLNYTQTEELFHNFSAHAFDIESGLGGKMDQGPYSLCRAQGIETPGHRLAFRSVKGMVTGGASLGIIIPLCVPSRLLIIGLTISGIYLLPVG